MVVRNRSRTTSKVCLYNQSIWVFHLQVMRLQMSPSFPPDPSHSKNTDTSINSHPGPGSLLHCCSSPPTSVNYVNMVVKITPWTSRSGNVALNSSLTMSSKLINPLIKEGFNLLKTCPPFTSPYSFVPSGQFC